MKVSTDAAHVPTAGASVLLSTKGQTGTAVGPPCSGTSSRSHNPRDGVSWLGRELVLRATCQGPLSFPLCAGLSPPLPGREQRPPGHWAASCRQRTGGLFLNRLLPFSVKTKPPPLKKEIDFKKNKLTQTADGRSSVPAFRVFPEPARGLAAGSQRCCVFSLCFISGF